MIDEALLQWVQRTVDGEPFNRSNRSIVRLAREHQARSHRMPIDHDGARSTNAMLTTDVGASQAAIVS